MAWFSDEHNAVLEERLHLPAGAALQAYQTDDVLTSQARSILIGIIDNLVSPPSELLPATIDVLIVYFGELNGMAGWVFYDEDYFLHAFGSKAPYYDAIIGPARNFRDRKNKFKALQEEAEKVVYDLDPEPRVVINGITYGAWFTPEHCQWLERLTGLPEGRVERILQNCPPVIARAAEAIFGEPEESEQPTILGRARFGDDYPSGYGSSGSSDRRHRSYRDEYPEYPSSLLPNDGYAPRRSGGGGGGSSSSSAAPWARPPAYTHERRPGQFYPPPYTTDPLGPPERPTGRRLGEFSDGRGIIGGSSPYSTGGRLNPNPVRSTGVLGNRYPSSSRDDGLLPGGHWTEATAGRSIYGEYGNDGRYPLRDPGAGPGAREARRGYRPSPLGERSPPRISRSSGLSRQGAIRRPGRGLGGEERSGSGSGRRPEFVSGMYSPPRSQAGSIYSGISPPRRSRRSSRERRYRFVAPRYW
ncbi:hypothetical protein CBER1_05881 [Cercospora berteroae]|uniref:Uncharacterized protein n=1 Tax=Cercospora berteroae TaxID=357750 RepID=A0A2S6C7G3_9PEZI|nr:hypothetical protein CBER1_05881 [Cercospora berteroae]